MANTKLIFYTLGFLLVPATTYGHPPPKSVTLVVHIPQLYYPGDHVPIQYVKKGVCVFERRAIILGNAVYSLESEADDDATIFCDGDINDRLKTIGNVTYRSNKLTEI